MLQVGTKIEGNWGAMHPMDEGEITEVRGEWVVVKFRDAGENLYLQSEILQPGEMRYGSPIGVYVAE